MADRRMILEVAVLDVIPGREAEFESAFRTAACIVYDPFPKVEHYVALGEAP